MMNLFLSSGIIDFQQKGFKKKLFFDNLINLLSPLEHNISNNKFEATLKNNVLKFKYQINIEINDKIEYKFNNTNLLIILFTILLIGMFLFKGNIGNYIFWGFIIFWIIYFINFTITKNFIVTSIEKILSSFSSPTPLNSNISISKQLLCPACGKLLSGFEDICPECGLHFSNNQNFNSTSISNFKDMKVKYFLIDKENKK
ncbi:MAG: hypothetical protein MJ211_02680 [Bacteroidales bacterium]|nr:hypothetical protein [Bacteroidales bacterium]